MKSGRPGSGFGSELPGNFGRLLMRDAYNSALYGPLQDSYEKGAKTGTDVWIHKNRWVVEILCGSELAFRSRFSFQSFKVFTRWWTPDSSAVLISIFYPWHSQDEWDLGTNTLGQLPQREWSNDTAFCWS